jgi:hypothetical protein
MPAYFIPTSLLLEQTDISFLQQTVIIENHQGVLHITNTSDRSQHLLQQFCMRYLLSNRPSQNTYFDRLSTLCKQYNEKKNNQVRNTSSTHCRSPNRAPKGTSDTHSHLANQTAARKIISSSYPMISSPTNSITADY